MSKATKFYSKLVVIVKVLTLLAFVWILFNQRHFLEKINVQAISNFNTGLFLMVLALVPLNWYFEFQKWKITLKSLDSFSRKESIESFLSGIFSGFITPNFIGNFVGRVLYYPFKIRPKIILFTLLASYSQFLTTITIGALFMLFYSSGNEFLSAQYHWIIFTFIVISWILYFTFEKLQLYKIKFLAFFRHFKLYRPNLSLKIQYIVFNLLRYIVFSVQYLLILNVFLEEFNLGLIVPITAIYFWSTLIPNFIWGKLFLRESVALVVLFPIIDNVNIILLASFSLSLINQIIPAIVGIPYLMKKKKYE